ncbi:MAG: Holliday junction resolvase RuvX [Patescibacteria group bacterium]
MLNKGDKILGIDYGDKRLGLALANVGSIAVPFKIMTNSGQSLFAELEQIIGEEDIKAVVVGLPHSLSGNINERLSITKNFIEQLKKHLNIPVEAVDEQFTSQLYSRQGIKQDLDKHSATAILDTYLQKNNVGL